MSAWVAPFAFEFGDSVETPRLSAILSQFDPSHQKGLVFGLYRHGTWGVSLGSGSRVFEIRAGNEEWRVHRNTWTHIAFSYDAATSTYGLWKDGQQVHTDRLPREVEVLLPSTALSVGRHSQAFDNGGPFKFNCYCGLANHVRIHVSSLDGEQLGTLIASDLAPRGGRAPIVRFEDIDMGPDYLATDRHRPGFHARPNVGWMNEPHAPIFYNGLYHLFFQKNPFGPFWHQIHWGHWVSTDLVNWREVDIALAPTDGGKVTSDLRPTSPAYAATVAPDGVWSGSAVLDPQGKPALIFTAGNNSKSPSEGVGLARPADASDPTLRDWVIHPEAIISQKVGQGHWGDFRDPFVFFDKSVSKYFALVASGTSRSGTALVFESEDLLRWDYRGPGYENDLNKHPGPGSVWELPVLLPVGTGRDGNPRWALLVNAHGPGSVLDVYYWIGVWNPVVARFHPDQEVPRRFDMGQGHFTGPSGMVDPKTGRSIVFSIAQGERPSEIDYDSGWAHSAGTPIEIRLGDDGDLHVRPIGEIETLRDKQLIALSNVSLLEANKALVGVDEDMLDIEVEFAIRAPCGVIVRISPDGSELTPVLFNPAVGRFVVTRSKSSIDPSQAARLFANGGSVKTQGVGVKLRVLVDRSLIEAYLDEKYSLTTRVYPASNDARHVQLAGDPGAVISRIEVYSMKRN